MVMTRTAAAVVGVVIAMVSGTGCSWLDPKPESDPGPTTTVVSPAGEPVVVIEGDVVFLDGKLNGTTRMVEEMGRLQKIDELFDGLQSKRIAFKAEHPNAPFPGRAAIAAEDDTTALVFKSVFQTAAYAGYPTLLIKTADGFVEVEAQVPGPPEEGGLPAVDEVSVRVGEQKIALVHKQGGVVVHEREMDRPGDADAAKLEAVVKNALVAHFLRHDVVADPVPTVAMGFENRERMPVVVAACEGAAGAQRELGGPGGGAFRVYLVMR